MKIIVNSSYLGLSHLLVDTMIPTAGDEPLATQSDEQGLYGDHALQAPSITLPLREADGLCIGTHMPPEHHCNKEGGLRKNTHILKMIIFINIIVLLCKLLKIDSCRVKAFY